MNFPSRECNGCKEIKPFSEFHKAGGRSKFGIHTRCKVCVSEYGRNYRNSDIQQIRRWLIRKEREVKKTYPIFKKCLGCRKEKPMVDFVPMGEKAKYKDGTIRFTSSCRPCENVRNLLFFKKHRDRLLPEARKRMNRFRKDKPEQFRETRLRSRKKQRENLDDGYIKKLLCDKSYHHLKWGDVPQELVDSYREVLKLKRLIKRKEKNEQCR